MSRGSSGASTGELIVLLLIVAPLLALLGLPADALAKPVAFAGAFGAGLCVLVGSERAATRLGAISAVAVTIVIGWAGFRFQVQAALRSLTEPWLLLLWVGLAVLLVIALAVLLRSKFASREVSSPPGVGGARVRAELDNPRPEDPLPHERSTEQDELGLLNEEQ